SADGVTVDGSTSGTTVVGGTTASISSNTAANLDQCRNGGITSPVPCSGSAWANGNAGSSNAHWLEGDSIAYRMKFSGLTPATSHTIAIEWDTTQSGKHAIDYLTTFNRSDAGANPCTDV